MSRRILFLGQKPIGKACLEIGFSDFSETLSWLGVVTNTKPTGWWHDNEVCVMAESRGIPVIDNCGRHEDQIADLILASRIDTLISVQHPWVLSENILNLVGGFAFNLHLAPLPHYKGYGAFSHAILNGEKEFGVEMHWMVPEVDAGAHAYTECSSVVSSDTASTLYEKACSAGISVFRSLLGDLARGTMPPSIPMSGEGQFYSRSSLDVFREITQHDDAETTDRKIRAFYFPPFPPAYRIENGERIDAVPTCD